METWMKVLAAIGIVMMIGLMWTRGRHILQNAPKGSSKDWLSALIPLLIVIAFVYFLLQSV